MAAKKPIYLFYGEEDFLIDEAVKRLKAAGDFSDFNFEVIDGEVADLNSVLNAILTQPMLSSRRMVVIKDLPVFSRSDEKEIEPLMKVLQSGEAMVVFTLSEVDKRRKFFKAVESLGEVKEFKPFAEWEGNKVIAWIVEKVRQSGKKIGAHAANLLYETSGSNLRILASEIDKLVTYIGERGHIEEKDVMALATYGKVNVFTLLDALRDKNIPKAHEALAKLLKDKEEPVGLVALLATQYRMLLQVKSLREEGLNIYQMA